MIKPPIVPPEVREFIRDKSQLMLAQLTARRAELRIQELDLAFGRQLLALRAAVIELRHGAGAEAAMKWIRNTLANSGDLPPEDATNAQEYFDREIETVDAQLAQVVAKLEAIR